MGPTRKRDLTAAVVRSPRIGYLVVLMVYTGGFPPITVLTGMSLLAFAVAEAGWAPVRSKIATARSATAAAAAPAGGGALAW